jgi:hypothetical protein
MAYCGHCGVQIEPGHQTCPLCLRELGGEDAPPLPANQAFAHDAESVSGPDELLKRRLGVAVGVASTLVAIPAIVCVLVDLLYNGGGWSRFVVASLVLVWWICFTPLLFFRKPLVICLTDVGLAGLFLVAVDLMTGWRAWSLVLGLPIVLAMEVFTVLLWLAFRLYPKCTGFVLATLFGGAAMLCLVIDAAISCYAGGRISLLWSLITLAAMMPLTLVSVVMQLVFFRSPRFQRYLHW